jgi:hypothetical protein
MKTDGRLDRDLLAGHTINALLAGPRHNLLLILNTLAFLLAWILYAARQPKQMTKPDTLPNMNFLGVVQGELITTTFEGREIRARPLVGFLYGAGKGFVVPDIRPLEEPMIFDATTKYYVSYFKIIYLETFNA